jgi:hypothetical protein
LQPHRTSSINGSATAILRHQGNDQQYAQVHGLLFDLVAAIEKSLVIFLERLHSLPVGRLRAAYYLGLRTRDAPRFQSRFHGGSGDRQIEET